MKISMSLLLIFFSLLAFSAASVGSENNRFQEVMENESSKEDYLAKEDIKQLEKIKRQKKQILKSTKKNYKSLVVMTEFDTSYEGYTLPRSENWYGLYCEKGSCKLIKESLEIRAMPLIDSSDEVELADIVNIKGNPVAFIHGVHLEEGDVSTAFISPYNDMPRNFYSDMKESNRWKVPGLSDFLLYREKTSNIDGFKYYIKHGEFEQFLIESTPSNMNEYGVDITLHWVGDLDRDGILDLIFSLNSYCTYENRLYLSSGLSKDKLYSLETAVEFSGWMAACGC